MGLVDGGPGSGKAILIVNHGSVFPWWNGTFRPEAREKVNTQSGYPTTCPLGVPLMGGHGTASCMPLVA